MNSIMYEMYTQMRCYLSAYELYNKNMKPYRLTRNNNYAHLTFPRLLEVVCKSRIERYANSSFLESFSYFKF